MATRAIVINRCYGGFGLSRAAFLRLREMGNEHAKREPDIGETWESHGSGGDVKRSSHLDSFCRDVPRDDPQMVRVVREMGSAASAPLARVEIVEIPGDVEWVIDEYDGYESVQEKHRSWP